MQPAKEMENEKAHSKKWCKLVTAITMKRNKSKKHKTRAGHVFVYNQQCLETLQQIHETLK